MTNLNQKMAIPWYHNEPVRQNYTIVEGENKLKNLYCSVSMPVLWAVYEKYKLYYALFEYNFTKEVLHLAQ